MRAFLAAGVLAIGAASSLPSIAQAGEAECSIRVLDAPSEIRDALVGWASSEKICHALEVRITPTGEGFSLWARADDGRTFTRWVANPRAAALLVVSWAGDDTLPAADPPPKRAPRAEVPASSQVSSRDAVPAAAATIDPPRYARGEITSTSARDRPRDHAAARSHQLVVAAIANPGAGEDVYPRAGLRASLDLTTHGAWRAGIAGMLSDERVHIYDVWTGGRVARASEPRASAIGYVARSLARDRVRLGAGAGFVYMQLSDVTIEPLAGTVLFDRVGIFAPAIEVSALGSFSISRRWAVTGGVVLTATGPSASRSLLKNDNHSFAPDHDGGAQIVGALGVARSL